MISKSSHSYSRVRRFVQSRFCGGIRPAEKWIPVNRETDFRCSQPAYYRIDVYGALDARWSCDYIGLQVECITDVNDRVVTRLTGELIDQSALLGLLILLNDLGAPLLSFDCVPSRQD